MTDTMEQEQQTAMTRGSRGDDQSVRESDLHHDVMTFLAVELARKAGKQCLQLVMTEADGQFREDPLLEYNRTDQPEIFENLSAIDELAAAILIAAEKHLDALGAAAPRDGMRFVLRTRQVLGSRAKKMFRMRPSAESAGASIGSGGIDPTLTGVLAMQMRQNDRMFEQTTAMTKGTVGILLENNARLATENAELRAENMTLRRERDAANTAEGAQMVAAMAQENSDKRKDVVLGKILQLSPIIAAKVLGSGKGGSGPSGVALVVNELAKSLDQARVMRIAGLLTMEERILFMEAIKLAKTEGATEPSPQPPTETTEAAPK